MEFTADRKQLADVLQMVSKACGGKVIPVTSGVLVEATEMGLTLTATDLEWRLAARCDAAVTEPGRIVVPKKFVEQITRLQRPEVSISVRKGQAKIDWMSGQASISCMDPDAYPAYKQVDLTDRADAEELKRIAELAFSVGDPMDIVCNCIMTDGENALTTDKRRLSLLKTTVKIPLVTARHFSALAQIMSGTVEYGVSGSMVRFAWDGGDALIRSVEGKTLDYKRFIPTNNITVKIDPLELIEALEIVLPIASETKKDVVPRVDLDMDGVQLVISSQSEGGRATEAIPCEGGTGGYRFNHKYLTDAVKYVAPRFMSFAGNGVWMENEGKSALVVAMTR